MSGAPSPSPQLHALSGWGESVHGWARVWTPRSPTEVADLFRRVSASGGRLCLRGAGRSYGDAALLARGDVLSLRGLRGIREFDPETGRAWVEAGVTIAQLWRHTLPLGWWPAVVPGTMHATVGGCVAMNVHGKNHFRAGGFGEHVEDLELVLPDGALRTVHHERDADLFRAVIGGLGLLGAVTAVRLRLRRVHSGLVHVTALPARSLADMHATLEERADGADHLVGWIDAFDRAGRGVIHAARHLDEGEDRRPEQTRAVAAQDLPARILGVVPRRLVPPLMRPLARPTGVRFVNIAKRLAARMRGTREFRQAHAAFAFLLDYVPGWKSVYAPGGLLQHQSFVPAAAAADVHGELLADCRDAGIVPWLAVVKKHRADTVLLAHSVDGYSLALDFPVTAANAERLTALCRRLDERVVAAGGRFYLAKDQTALPATLHAAYPGLARFREWKRELDPSGLLTSDQAVRLGLTTLSI